MRRKTLRDFVLSSWEHQSFFGPADVAIIGAGLVGLTAALYLKQLQPAWHVVVLERGALPSGASTKKLRRRMNFAIKSTILMRCWPR